VFASLSRLGEAGGLDSNIANSIGDIGYNAAMYVNQEDTVKIFKEFKDFVSRGNVMDLAVAVVMGAAFTAIINSLVSDLITPLLSIVTGGYDFSQLVLVIGSAEHPAKFSYGSFLAAVINFLAISVVIFVMVKVMNKFSRKKREETPTQVCPYCAEEIPAAAVRCPSCTTVLDANKVPEELR
jgi:large conductance mechanosensitive channel